MSYIFFHALLIGFFLSAPIGPVNLICIRRTLLNGKWPGFVSGLGAATADAIYAFLAILGFKLLISFILQEITMFRIVGGIFIACIGAKTFYNKTSLEPSEECNTTNYYISTFLITLANPLTLLSFIAVLTTFPPGHTNHPLTTIVLIITGIVAGAILWWVTIVSITSLFRDKMTEQKIGLINRICGGLIVCTGILAMVI